jgi:hypothetical protein
MSPTNSNPIEVGIGTWLSYRGLGYTIAPELLLVVGQDASGWLVVGVNSLRLLCVHPNHIGPTYKPLLREAATPDQCAYFLAQAQANAVDAHKAAVAADIARDRRESEWREWVRQEGPKHNAKAIIVAEYVESACRPMEDLYDTVTKRRHIIGWSKSTRFSFKECRLAAANFAETAYLAGLNKDAEHRENYSMGHGNYLKAESSRYDTGWEVRKEVLDIEAASFPRACDIPLAMLSEQVLAAVAAMAQHEASATQAAGTSLADLQTGIPQFSPRGGWDKLNAAYPGTEAPRPWARKPSAEPAAPVDNRPLAKVIQFPTGGASKKEDDRD